MCSIVRSSSRHLPAAIFSRVEGFGDPVLHETHCHNVLGYGEQNIVRLFDSDSSSGSSTTPY